MPDSEKHDIVPVTKDEYDEEWEKFLAALANEQGQEAADEFRAQVDVEDAAEGCLCEAYKYNNVHLSGCPADPDNEEYWNDEEAYQEYLEKMADKQEEKEEEKKDDYDAEKDPKRDLFAEAEVCNCSFEKYKYEHTKSCPGGKLPGAGDHLWEPEGASDWQNWSYSSCDHDRDEFGLEDGLSIMASAWRDVKTVENEGVDVGIYFADSWSREFPVLATPGLEVPWAPERHTRAVLFEWPDMGVPKNKSLLAECVRWTLSRLAEGDRIDCGCLGSHGRTGTFLSILLVAQGLNPVDAITRVREHHCEKAVESNSQVDLVAEMYKAFHGNEEWRKSKTLRKRFAKLTGTKSYSSGGSHNKGAWTSGAWAEVWNPKIGLWTCKGYRQGLTWSKEHAAYVREPTPEELAKLA